MTENVDKFLKRLENGEIDALCAAQEVKRTLNPLLRVGSTISLGSALEHFGIDLQSGTGYTTVSTPFADEVVVSDACSACTAANSDEGNTPGDTRIDYNFGYGAMIVVEYVYGDLNEQERNSLADDGIDLEEGQSVYIMLAHLDPHETLAGSGATLAGGSELAYIGNSGNSGSAHAHVEVAINDSGLQPSADQAGVKFWLLTVVERDYLSDVPSERQGNRVDPSGLFD